MITKDTYEWIKEISLREDSSLSFEDYVKLSNNYFKISKGDWYKDDNWNMSKVRQFWYLLRKYVITRGEKQKYYDFEGFVFPEEEIAIIKQNEIKSANFFENINVRIFNHEMNFKNTKFLGSLTLENLQFEKKLIFEGAIFNGKFSIKNNCIFKEAINFQNIRTNSFLITSDCIFHEQIDFKNSNFVGETIIKGDFLDKVNLYKSSFSSRTVFEDTQFKSTVDFNSTVFQRNAIFKNTIFFNICNFNKAKFLESVDILSAIFKKEAFFTNIFFKENINFQFIEVSELLNFENSKFTEEKKIKFLDIKGLNPKLSFKNTILSKNISFKRVFFKNVSFLEADLTNVKFRECEWGGNSRIILHDEKIINKKDKGKLKSLEVLYRQLKRNFDTTKDWELSGKAYVSEMKIRQQRLWLEKKYYQWSIYKFYDLFGGYTQDFRKPMISLLGLILLFSGIYFFIDYDIVKALQRGIKGALPYMQIDTENPFQGYWLILRNLQLVLGGTFLAFFVLALRKRFKQ